MATYTVRVDPTGQTTDISVDLTGVGPQGTPGAQGPAADNVIMFQDSNNVNRILRTITFNAAGDELIFTGADGNTRIFTGGGTAAPSDFMAQANAAPAGVSTFTTGRTAVITIATESPEGAVSSIPPSSVPGVESITGSHPTYTVTFDISSRAQVRLPFTVSDGTTQLMAIATVEVGFVPFFLTAGALPTALPPVPVAVPYGPQTVIFPNQARETLYMLIEDDNNVANLIMETSGFRVVPVVEPSTITATDLNGNSQTYTILNLGTSTRSSQTVTILET